MQTKADTERILMALSWRSARLANGAYRIQGIDGDGLWIGLVNKQSGDASASVMTVYWSLN